MTLSDLTLQDQVHANLTLSGDFKEQAGFVAAGGKGAAGAAPERRERRGPVCQQRDRPLGSKPVRHFFH